MIADDFRLQAGDIERATFNIASRIEENMTLLDIVNSALDLELTNRGKMFVLYDDFGKLALKSLGSMKTGVVIDGESAENFDYSSGIYDGTYNRVKLTLDNEETGKREVYVAQDGENINRWGVLQYFGTLKDGENGGQKADALLALHNVKGRKLKIRKAFGDLSVRGGSLVIVKLALGDIALQSYMLVEKATHTFGEGEHWMDLTLRGGEIIG
jgi:hypothetical protein